MENYVKIILFPGPAPKNFFTPKFPKGTFANHLSSAPTPSGGLGGIYRNG